MQLSSLKTVDVDDAFKDFSILVMASGHFREIFDSQQQVDALTQRRADNFYQSLSMSDEAFRENYLEIGLMSAKLKLPFEVVVVGLSLVRRSLLKNTSVEATVIYDVFEKMERYLAKGYLVYQFDDVLSQLEFSIENIEAIYVESEQEVVRRPISWLKQIVTGFQENKTLEHADILTADLCPLTPLIHALDVEDDLKQRILISHAEQHSLALSMAFFFREANYVLANFMFGRLFAITVSLSNQIGLAVSHQEIEVLQYDALTGLRLRHGLARKFQEMVDLSVLENKSISIMLLDADHFKNINDSWGHQAGDKVLTMIGELVLSNQRANDFTFRYGGEEFLILITDASLNSLQVISERIRQQVETLNVEWEGEFIPLSMSIGALFIEANNLNLPIERYIEKADLNLYRAKNSGRNKVVISTFMPT